MATLDEIAVLHRTDKSSRRHNYAQFYDRIFSGVRTKDVRLLEVGIGTADTMGFMGKTYLPGASLRMWAQYFPNAQLVAGIDTDPECLFQEGCIRTALADSRDRESVAAALRELGTEQFDVILDDGLHTQAAQMDTLQALHHTLDPYGVYVIEDIRRPELLLSKLQGLLPGHRLHLEPFASLQPRKRLLDSNVVVALPGCPEGSPEGTVAGAVLAALSRGGEG
mmetsp:Transcript_100867/g.314444  ORF Transcript_100867/g.314444 Transcript_100867/m.314444 type:complete len:223 (+) Transcript_100867:112-780(+)